MSRLFRGHEEMDEDVVAEKQLFFNSNLIHFIAATDDNEDTVGHSQFVANYSLLLTRELGITDRRFLVDIERGALLHDIGKIGIPESILMKNGPLTTDRAGDRQRPSADRLQADRGILLPEAGRAGRPLPPRTLRRHRIPLRPGRGGDPPGSQDLLARGHGGRDHLRPALSQGPGASRRPAARSKGTAAPSSTLSWSRSSSTSPRSAGSGPRSRP